MEVSVLLRYAVMLIMRLFLRSSFEVEIGPGAGAYMLDPCRVRDWRRRLLLQSSRRVVLTGVLGK